MKLKTKVAVSYNAGITGTTSSIVEGHLVNVSFSGDGQELGANYIYTTEEDEAGNNTVIAQNGFILKGQEIENLYDAVKGSIPEGLDYRSTQQYTYYLGFLYQMAQTFGVQTTDIEIIE